MPGLEFNKDSTCLSSEDQKEKLSDVALSMTATLPT